MLSLLTGSGSGNVQPTWMPPAPEHCVSDCELRLLRGAMIISGGCHSCRYCRANLEASGSLCGQVPASQRAMLEEWDVNLQIDARQTATLVFRRVAADVSTTFVRMLVHKARSTNIALLHSRCRGCWFVGDRASITNRHATGLRRAAAHHGLHWQASQFSPSCVEATTTCAALRIFKDEKNCVFPCSPSSFEGACPCASLRTFKN